MEVREEIKARGFEYDYDSLEYELVWQDEFDKDGLPDETKWSYDVGGHGWGNGEYQYYTEGKNCFVKDGKLVIEARKEPWGGRDYTSCRLVSKGKGDWLYGKFEVRARLPKGLGNWPAIWMLPTDWEYGEWPISGEIDIMEHVGYDLNTVHASIHTQSYNHCDNTQKTACRYVDGVCEGFHVYTMEWLPDCIMAFVDGERYFTFRPADYGDSPGYREWPFDRRMHLILNLAIGGGWGASKGFDENAFPQQMLVDYVRVYQSREVKKLVCRF